MQASDPLDLIAWRRAHDPACSRKGTRDQRGVGEMADIDCDIHPALQRIAGLHQQMHLDAGRWMLLAKNGDQRRKLRGGKSRRRADAKRVAMQVVWRDRRIRLFHRVDGAQRVGTEFLAFGRQRHPAAGTAEQPDAKAILQRRTSLLTADGVSERLHAAAEKSPSATARVKTRSSL
jgi:hypothetical protein